MRVIQEHLENIHADVNDIYEQFDRGKATFKDVEKDLCGLAEYLNAFSNKMDFFEKGWKV